MAAPAGSACFLFPWVRDIETYPWSLLRLSKTVEENAAVDDLQKQFCSFVVNERPSVGQLEACSNQQLDSSHLAVPCFCFKSGTRS